MSILSCLRITCHLESSSIQRRHAMAHSHRPAASTGTVTFHQKAKCYKDLDQIQIQSDKRSSGWPFFYFLIFVSVFFLEPSTFHIRDLFLPSSLY
eukprot:s1031_g7.t1